MNLPAAAPTLLLATALVSGCGSLPAADPSPSPGASVPEHWAQAPASPAVPPTDLARWWERFDDPALTALVQDALAANPSVKSAVAALRQSRALVDLARAGYSPRLNASASAQASRMGSAASQKQFDLGLDASWEPDLFGATRAGVSAAEADARAAQMNLADAQVSLAAEVALAYVDLRGSQARRDIAEHNLQSQRDTLQIASWRHQAGLVSALDVEQATAAAAQTEAQVPSLQTSVEQAWHRLAVLTGRAPGALAALEAGGVPLPPDDLALAFPADTLRQRPDVRAAEAHLLAAAERVTQANAARYPSLSLGGTLGLQAGAVDMLFDHAALVRRLLASVAAPLFDGGAIDAQVRAQQAALEQARAAHESAVLGALQEVEDALAALRGNRLSEASLRTAAAAAERADRLARQQYESGLIDFNAVLNAQRTLLSAQDGAQTQLAALAAGYVRLYKALGGGW